MSQTQTTPASLSPPAAVAPASAGNQVRGRRMLGLPRTFWVLWVGMLINRAGGGVFCLLAVYLTVQRGLRAELAGLVISLHAAGGVFAGPIGGALADRFGRRATLLAGTLTAGTLMLALGLARATATIFVLAPLLGFCTQLSGPAAQAAIADLVEPADRTRAYGLTYWAINLGFAFAASVGGVLAQRSFTLLFVIDAATTLAYGAIVLLYVPETRPAVLAAPSRRTSIADMLVPFRDRALMTLIATQVLVLLVFTQVIVALPMDMHAHGLSTDRIGVLLGLNGVVIVLLQPLALRLTRRVPPVSLLAAGAALTGVGLGSLALASDSLSYALATVIFTLGEIGFSTATPPLIAHLAPPERRGAYQGTNQLAWGVASLAAPVVGSAVLAHAGSRALWLGCLAAGLGGAVLHWTVTRRRIEERLAGGPGG